MTRSAADRRQLTSDMRELLASLGDDAVEIASGLESLGVRGAPRDPHGCALAVFLHALVAGEPAVSSIEVTEHAVLIRTRSRWPGRARIRLSAPLRRFVRSFDAGLLPALVRVDLRGRGDLSPHHGCRRE